jgi:hypothetical protein
MGSKSFRVVCLVGALVITLGCNAILGIHDLSDGGVSPLENDGSSDATLDGNSRGDGASGQDADKDAKHLHDATEKDTGPGESGLDGPTDSSTDDGESMDAADSTDTGPGRDSASDAGPPACPPGLEDKSTLCEAGAPTCVEGCGPDLPAGSTQTNLGSKSCACSVGVYECAVCVYETPLAACYQPAATPPACAMDVGDKLACGTVCTGSGGPGPCTIITDTGRQDGCVCIMGSTAQVWTCATEWW